VTGPGEPPPGGDAPRDLADLRELLVGTERRAIADLRRRLDALELTPEEVADRLPDAIALRASRDDQLARALAPTLEGAIGESVQRNPQQFAQAIYPSLGPAIRRAIREAMAGMLAGINHAIEHSLSWQGLKWRVEAWRTGVPFPQIVMKHALVYRVEQVYLIHGETSVLLAHVAAPDLVTPDADLVSGMLTAIRDFVSDSFNAGEAGGLRTFTVGELTVLVEPGPRALLAAVVRGESPPDLLERLQRTLELLHFQFASQLNRFDGDAAPFDHARPLLAECLETVLETDRPRRRSLAPRLAWALALLVVAALVTVAVVSQLRWRRAVAALRAQPGLVVLDARRGLGSWRFAGLRDPLAADPRAVLAGLGVDTGRVGGTWTPYVSADAAIVLARARRVLDPPPGVQLAVAGDTVVASGSADLAWLEAAPRRVPGILGVVRLDVARVAPQLPAALRPLADSVQGALVLFAPGSAELTPEAGGAVRAAAGRLRRLQAAVATGWVVAVRIVGRTDTTGSHEMNRQLSEERAQVVARALARLGLVPARLAATGTGASDPLPAGPSGDVARTNRSVAFTVLLRPAAPEGGAAP
jgi:outer membrane protein OmpA-like peptidoglycan-associated protein